MKCFSQEQVLDVGLSVRRRGKEMVPQALVWERPTPGCDKDVTHDAQQQAHVWGHGASEPHGLWDLKTMLSTQTPSPRAAHLGTAGVLVVRHRKMEIHTRVTRGCEKSHWPGFQGGEKLCCTHCVTRRTLEAVLAVRRSCTVLLPAGVTLTRSCDGGSGSSKAPHRAEGALSQGTAL